MQTSEPTTLYVPPTPQDQPQSPTQVVALLAAIIPIVVGIAWLMLLLRRRARLRPEEHAFRSLASRMRLGRSQVIAVRRCARDTHREPIDVLMDEQLLHRVLRVD